MRKAALADEREHQRIVDAIAQKRAEKAAAEAQKIRVVAEEGNAICRMFFETILKTPEERLLAFEGIKQLMQSA